MSAQASRTTPVGLPGGAPLAPGEKPLVGDRFMLSTVAFYLHTDLVLTNRRLYAIRPNVLLGLVPVGASRSNFPIDNIAGVTAATRFDVPAVLIGTVGTLVGILALTGPLLPVGVILIVIGLLLILGSPKQTIEVMNSGGGTIPFHVSVLQRSRTVEFANLVSEAIARTTARTGPLVGGAAGQPTRADDPTEALSQLSRMRQQGLITEAEFSAKRAEIIARL